MGVLNRANEILETIKVVAVAADVVLPDEEWVQVGQPAITCESICVGVLNMSPTTSAETSVNASGVYCSPIINVSFIAVIAREGDPTHHDGSNYIYGLTELSEEAERDGEVLWETITSAMPGSLAGTTGAVLNYEIEGGLIATSITFSTGI